jgi:hypothetical protein
MIFLRKNLSDGLIALKLMWLRQWNIFEKYSKCSLIELDGGQAVEAARQELLLKVVISD